jgi:putative transposase
MELTQQQRYEEMLKEVSEKGFEVVFKNCIEMLMRAEREIYKEENNDYSNGYRPINRYGLSCGKVLQLQVPRTRNGGFKPLLLGLLKDREQESNELAFELYSCGLTTEQTGKIFDKIYGRGYSTSQISRMFDYARKDVAKWQKRSIEEHYPVCFIDATFIPTCRVDKVSREAYHTVLAIKEDGTREVLGIYNNPCEGANFYHCVFDDLRKRGLKQVDLFVTDALAGIENVISEEFPDADIQFCCVHLKRQFLTKVKRAHKAEMSEDLKDVFRTDDSSDTIPKARSRWEEFINKWRDYYPFMNGGLTNKRYEYYFTYIKFNYKVRNLLYSTNYIERLNRDFKRTVRMRGSLPNVDSALLLLCSVAMNKQQTYSRVIPRLKYEEKLFSIEIDNCL